MFVYSNLKISLKGFWFYIIMYSFHILNVDFKMPLIIAIITGIED